MPKAEYIGVSGVARKVKSHHIGVNAVARKVKSGYVGISGVARQFFQSGIYASDLAVGSSVYLMENGVAVEYLVIQQGKPSALYADSCDGTWLLRKDISGMLDWDSDGDTYLESSDIHKWLQSTMFSRYGTELQSIIKQVKIPYYKKTNVFTGSTQSGENGLSCKVFLLSAYEVGFTADQASFIPDDGAVLSYFNGVSNSKRIAYLNGSAETWWLRSPHKDSYEVVCVGPTGVRGRGNSNSYYGIRPALVIPSNTPFNQETMQILP